MGVSGSSSIGGAGTARTTGSGETGPPAASSFSMCTISRLRNWKASAYALRSSWCAWARTRSG